MEVENNHKVYLITNNLSGKEYVGITKDHVWKRYNSHVSAALKGKKSYIFHKALRKYPIEVWEISILREGLSRPEAIELERLYIKVFNTLVPSGYNSTPGGESIEMTPYIKNKISEAQISRNFKHSAASKALMSQKRKGIPKSAETKEKIGIAHKGRIVSKYSRLKMSYAQKQVVWTEERKIKTGNILRKQTQTVEHSIRSAERITKLNKSRIGQEHSEEHKKKISESITGDKNPFYGRTHSEETRAKLREKNTGKGLGGSNPSAKKLCYKDEVYGCIKEFLEELKIDRKEYLRLLAIGEVVILTS